MCVMLSLLGAEERLSQGSKRFFPDTTSFKFVCECFFITQRALHVGIIPAINTFTKILSDLGKQIAANVPDCNEKLLKELNAVSLQCHYVPLLCPVRSIFGGQGALGYTVPLT